MSCTPSCGNLFFFDFFCEAIRTRLSPKCYISMLDLTLLQEVSLQQKE